MKGGMRVSIVEEVERWRKSLSPIISGYLRGFINVITFSDSGPVRHFRIPKRVLLLSVIFLFVATIGSSFSVVRLFRAHYDALRIASLEQENRRLSSLLESQAGQLEKLKVEINRLKEFEKNLRAISGLNFQGEPVLGTGYGGEKSAPHQERLQKQK